LVDLSEIQAAYYMVAATGVLVAAVFYVMNLRETTRNRRTSFANNLQINIQDQKWQQLYMEVMNMQWRDFDDFKKRYDSSVDVESYSKRHSVLMGYDILGWQFRKGLVDVDSFTDVWILGIVLCWHKFKPIIEGYRGWQYPKGAYRDFEYLAKVLEKKLSDEDPDFMKKMNTFFMTPVVTQ
jgi:hypothetical protein